MWKLTKNGVVVAECLDEPVFEGSQFGWRVGGTVYVDPDRLMLAELSTIPRIGPIAFQMLFKVDELVAIDTAKEANAAIRIFWKLLDDPRTDYVDRNLGPIQSMLQSLEAGGLIGPGRAQEIIYGEIAK